MSFSNLLHAQILEAAGLSGAGGLPEMSQAVWRLMSGAADTDWPGLRTDSVPRRPSPAGGLTRHTLRNVAGQRDYLLYVPAHCVDQSMPLVVMLHGCHQSADDFIAGTRMNELADEHGFVVAYPEQSHEANSSGCWNWFLRRDQRRGGGEPSLIAGIVREVAGSQRIDARRIYVAGMSAGGAMAAILARTYPDLFAAVGVHSGLPYGAAHDFRSALDTMKNGPPDTASALAGVFGASRPVPTIVFHGDRDYTVNVRNGIELTRRSASCNGTDVGVDTGTDSEVIFGPGGRRCTRSVRRDGRGRTVCEQWLLHGAGHAWSGGSAQGSYTDSRGPDASAEMARFFLQHAR